MARDLIDTEYYISHGGKIPIKWTAPEVSYFLKSESLLLMKLYETLVYYRQFTTRSTPLPVMCGALVVSCMRYGVLDILCLKCIQVLNV